MPDKRVQSAVVLFADLVGSARASDVLPPLGYDSIVGDFQGIAATLQAFLSSSYRLSTQRGISQCSGGIVGDELALILVLNDQDPASEALAAQFVIELAVRLQAIWCFSRCNLPRIRQNVPLHGIAVGIHHGPIVTGQRREASWVNTSGRWRFRRESKARPIPGGFSINFAKRVETASRLSCGIRLAVSQSFVSMCRRTGIPIEIGEALPADAKGFEDREPVYAISTQYAITHGVLSQVSSVSTGYQRGLLVKAYRRDPQRLQWLMELAIDECLLNKEYTAGIRLAESALVANNAPSLVYRAARCYHRRASPGRVKNRDDLRTAMSYYHAASQDPRFLWARLDLAAAHWKLAQAPNIDSADRDTSYLNALAICDEAISLEPRHFYGYNLRAFVASERLVRIPGQLFGGDQPKRWWLARAGRDLATARQLNPAPNYLYLGTQAMIEAAKRNRQAAVGYLAKALQELPLVSGASHADLLPASHYWQPGFAIPCALPPRRSQLSKNWQDRLRELGGEVGSS